MFNTVFPRNLITVKFYFKAPFGVATNRAAIIFVDLENGVYMQALSFNNIVIVCTYNACVHTYIHVAVDPLLHSKILGAAFNGMSWQKHAVRF